MINERDREVQIRAVLGRFSGNRKQAIEYCLRTAEENPKLRAEYLMYKQTIEWEGQ